MAWGLLGYIMRVKLRICICFHLALVKVIELIPGLVHRLAFEVLNADECTSGRLVQRWLLGD